MQGIISIVLLLISNVFMTIAWYGHLKFRTHPIFLVIVVSWLIAFFEYCFQVPANRIGSYAFTTAQLKVIQEVITLLVFAGFSVFYLKEQLHWNHAVAFFMVIGAVFFVFYGGQTNSEDKSTRIESSDIKSTKYNLMLQGDKV